MKQITFITIAIMLFSCSNNEKSNGSNTKEVEILKKENELLKKQIEIDSLKHTLASDKPTTEKKGEATSAGKTGEQIEKKTEPESLIRTGKHLLTPASVRIFTKRVRSNGS